MTEEELVVAVITHKAGFDLDLFGGMLCARGTEQGVFCVSWNTDAASAGGPSDQEEEFKDPVEAATFFVQKRHELKLGMDYENG